MKIGEDIKKNLYLCNKCGLCLESCPVYREIRTETSSPRGKLQLAKHIIEGDLKLSQLDMKIFFSQCILCGSCSIACPSSAHQNDVISIIRWAYTEKYNKDNVDKIAGMVISNKWLIDYVYRISSYFTNAKLGKRLNLDRIKLNKKTFNKSYSGIFKPKQKTNKKVLYFHGCATNYALENIGKSIISVLNALGIEVEIPNNQKCCGFPMLISGDRDLFLKYLKNTLKLFVRDDVETVVVDCATCYSALKFEYKKFLNELKQRGKRIENDLIGEVNVLSKKTREITEYVNEQIEFEDVNFPVLNTKEKINVTYHDPCHLKTHGIMMQPRNLLKKLPSVNFVDMESKECCGGGGLYQIKNYSLSRKITKHKIENIYKTNADIVVTSCPSCNITLNINLAKDKNIKVLHPIELLNSILTNTIK